MKSKNQCCICHQRGNIGVTDSQETSEKKYSVCRECNKYLLQGLYEFEKGSVLTKSIQLSAEEDIHLPYAINAVRGRYTLKEAKKRSRLRERERRGQTMDIYTQGQRVSGSFGSRQ